MPLAIVEAKRTSYDPEKGAKQAELYANSYEAKYGRRPFIFMTNGLRTVFLDEQGGVIHAGMCRAFLRRMICRCAWTGYATDFGRG